MRLFIAIQPDEKILSSLKSFQQRAISFSPAPRPHEAIPLSKEGVLLHQKSPWRPANDMHVTLQFLGNDVTLHQSSEIKKALADACAQIHPFDMDCTGAGAFPNSKNARILYAGISSPSLMQCAKIVNEKLSSTGFKPDKPFSAHVTLARTKFIQNAELFVNEYNSIKWHDEKWHVDSISLIESVTELGGYEYKTLETYRLR